MTDGKPKRKINVSWIKRRWLDFRNGHSTYLIFVMGFFQFTVVTYALAIERLPVLKEIFPSMSIWLAFFVAVYIPSAIIIGDRHLKLQKPSEDRQNTLHNPFTFKMSPGKEELFSLPAAVVQYTLQEKSMRIHNQTADIFLSAFGTCAEKWKEEEIEEICLLKEKAIRLLHNEDIRDIDKSINERKGAVQWAPKNIQEQPVHDA